MSNNFTIRVYGLILNASTEILLSDEFRFNQLMTKFPGGGLEYGEGLVDCLKREIKEETGVIDLTLIKDLGHYERYKISLEGGDDKSELKKIFMYLFYNYHNVKLSFISSFAKSIPSSL